MKMVFLGTNGKSTENGNNSGVDSSAGEEDDHSTGEREGRIRVGRDFQAQPPAYITIEQRKPDQCPERALLVWSPSINISNTKLDEYIQVSKEKYGYNAEQALGMLFWHKHDLDKAMQDLANFTPFPDEWTVEDKVLFEQAFQFHGKSFHRIRQMLPDKSIAQLVKYYYSWKKTRTRTSLMDRQARKLQSGKEDQGGEEVEMKEQSDDDDKDANSTTPKPNCFNCGILCHVTHSTPKGQMCGTCHQYFTRTGNIRPTTGPIRKDGTKNSKHSLFKNNSKPPKGMYVNHDDLVSLATGPNGQGETLLKAMDREIISYKRVVQNNKQLLSSLQRRSREKDIEPYRIPTPENKFNARWKDDELLLGVQGVRKYGKNFKIIAEAIGTKTESNVRSFFVNYRRRYNLDAALKEYEAENGPLPEDDEVLKMELERSSSATEVVSESAPGSPSNNSSLGDSVSNKNGNPISAK
ncbi:REST corepressor 1 isoform X2 [Lepeophtheirus salmonis]|uniref:REST corepressor 1 isoform X2 n=1 Tax=Lepeophtheirus salmonis TaxID=72036 RepID=UPI001AE877FA|nr:REST corepressor 1-like isoform X2 [Lepeophtheirus salmonis]